MIDYLNFYQYLWFHLVIGEFLFDQFDIDLHFNFKFTKLEKFTNLINLLSLSSFSYLISRIDDFFYFTNS